MSMIFEIEGIEFKYAVSLDRGFYVPPWKFFNQRGDGEWFFYLWGLKVERVYLKNIR